MKKYLVMVLAALMVMVCSPAVFAEDGTNAALNFTLANQTGVTIHRLQMSPSTTANWEEDMLGSEVMADGTERAITFSGYRSDVTLWDLRVTDGEGTSIEWRGLDLTAITKLTLRIVDGTPVAERELVAAAPAAAGTNAALNFTLANQTGVTIHRLQMSPSTTANWEEDMLGSEVMADGTERAITFNGYRTDVALWDLRVTDGEGTSIEWRGLDLTTITKLTLRIVDGAAVAERE